MPRKGRKAAPKTVDQYCACPGTQAVPANGTRAIAAAMTRTVSATGMDWGVLAAAGALTLVPGAVVIWFVRNHIAKGFALGRV